MPLYASRCTSDACGHLVVEYRPLARYADCPICPKCDGPTEKAYVPSGYTINSPAIVLFKADDGTFRFPGDPNGKSAAKYADLGYQRIEAKGWAEVRRLEKQVNAQQSVEIRRRAEDDCRLREESTHRRRSDFFHGIQHGFQMPEMRENSSGELVPTGRMKTVHLGELGRAVAMAAVARNNAKSRPNPTEAGGHFEVYSFDRSNRDESRRPDGTRCPD